MEVAGQWRRQWAGSAEYGKVTEGGVTRNVARAMEVLHASAPGARVRVMRAAYHSSAGPGAPASSYVMHSSRQVISSGYNFLEPTLTPSKPLEISSTPLGSLRDSEVERENYKVTEPDDYDISEPSKWRGSSGNNSIRMPSEESSSADNASIIDLDSRSTSTSSFKKSLQSKHGEEKSRTHIINTRVSPLLDAPVALSTLKYTSILNSSDEWNGRRKSYSFEDTSPLDNNVLPQNNSHTIDSSTDSGICKSSEIVDDSLNNPASIKPTLSSENNYQDESFKQWLSRNRSKSYRDTSTTPPRSYRATESKETAGNITLQSTGKVSITLPFDSQKTAKTEKIALHDDNDRKTKRVEFCKTELHFAVDTGTVNIIATDEKPPPSNDFRRRRSAFVPLNNKVDRSITLFGEKSEFSQISDDQGILNECAESDENIAATKSILKNKIPKPKPYLLGENMVIGNSSVDKNSLDFTRNLTKTSAVSLINSQLQSERRFSNDTISSNLSDIDSTALTTNTNRTRSKGPERHSNQLKLSNDVPIEILDTKSLNKKVGILPVTSEISKTKVRELRGRDLAYFGIDNNETSKHIQSTDNLQEEIFHSVKLVQQVSNSVCNSEAESDDTPEYQNIPTKLNFNKVPTPSPRSKYYKDTNTMSEQRVLKPISEQVTEHTVVSEFKNNSLKRHKDPLKHSRQVTDESSKTKAKQCRQRDTKDNARSRFTSPGKSSDNTIKSIKSNKENETSKFTRDVTSRRAESPLYVNINFRDLKEKREPTMEDSSLNTTRLRSSVNKDVKANKLETRIRSASSDKKESITPVLSDSKDKKYVAKQESHQRSQKKHTPKRTEKLTTPDIIIREISSEKTPKEVKKVSSDKNCTPKVQRSESLKRNSAQNTTKVNLENGSVPNVTKKDVHNKENGTVKLLNHSSLSDHKPSSKSSRNAVTSQKIEKIPGTKLEKSTKPKRSKYVINYDDKNGTVSSICKIKKGPGTYKRKIIEIDDKNLQESKTKEKSLNKIALLHFPGENWNTFDQDARKRKRKTFVHAQRSCQLL